MWLLLSHVHMNVNDCTLQRLQHIYFDSALEGSTPLTVTVHVNFVKLWLKTLHTPIINEIPVIAGNECYTLTLSRHTIYKAMDGQVYIHVRPFVKPVVVRQSTIGSIWSFWGTDRILWGAIVLTTTISVYHVGCGYCCAILNTQHCFLWSSGWLNPPLATHLPTPPYHPPIPDPTVIQWRKTIWKPISRR